MDQNSKQFKDLQSKWYGKLKKKGFEDIEQDEDTLKEWDTNFFRNKFNETLYKSKEDYYRLAGQFLFDHEFKSKKDKLIWDLHSQGIGRHEIVRILKSKNFKAYSRLVQETIQNLAKEMINKCR